MERVIARLEQGLMAVAAVIMVLVMLIVAYDSVARYALNAPLPWAFELLNYYLLVALAYFAVSATFQRGDHIGVDLLYNLMGRRGKLWCDLISSVLGLGLFAAIAYASWQSVMTMAGRGAIIPGSLSLPASLSYLPVTLGAAVMTLRLAHHVTALIRHGEDPSVVVHEVEEAP